MYPQVKVDMALRLSAIGILDKENARICGVSIAAIRHWRGGRRRGLHCGPLGTAAQRRASCPRCHGRSMNESAYAYLLGLYLGDGYISRGRRDVYALWIACCDDWPGLMAAARRAMSDVMPTSSVFCVHQQGCTKVKRTSKHWPCLFPAARAWTEAHSGNRTRPMAVSYCTEIPRRIRQGAVPFGRLARR